MDRVTGFELMTFCLGSGHSAWEIKGEASKSGYRLRYASNGVNLSAMTERALGPRL